VVGIVFSSSVVSTSGARAWSVRAKGLRGRTPTECPEGQSMVRISVRAQCPGSAGLLRGSAKAAEPDPSTVLKVWITLARLRLGRVARHVADRPCAAAQERGTRLVRAPTALVATAATIEWFRFYRGLLPE